MKENNLSGYSLEELLKKKYDKIKSDKAVNRFKHSISTSEKAIELAKRYYPNDKILHEKARIAGILHDYAKFTDFSEFEKISERLGLEKVIKDCEVIYHSLFGPFIISEELGITDEEILNAIKYHAMGHANMTKLEAIIYVADFIEDTRTGSVFDFARKHALNSLNEAVGYISKETISFLLEENKYIYLLSIETYNYYCKYITNLK